LIRQVDDDGHGLRVVPGNGKRHAVGAPAGLPSERRQMLQNQPQPCDGCLTGTTPARPGPRRVTRAGTRYSHARSVISRPVP
jgi:hypothetical protein